MTPMASLILSCLIWVKPQGFPRLESIQVPIDMYGMATMNYTAQGLQFESNVSEERINFVKISSLALETSAEAYSASSSPLTTLTTRLTAKEIQASLDCDIVSQAGDSSL